VIRLPSAVLDFAGIVGAARQAGGQDLIFGPGKARELRHLDWSLREEERWDEAPPAGFDLSGGFAHTVASWRIAGRLL
jgi:hypothetical protein